MVPFVFLVRNFLALRVEAEEFSFVKALLKKQNADFFAFFLSPTWDELQSEEEEENKERTFETALCAAFAPAITPKKRSKSYEIHLANLLGCLREVVKGTKLKEDSFVSSFCFLLRSLARAFAVRRAPFIANVWSKLHAVVRGKFPNGADAKFALVGCS